jgi:hypothetical protein
MTARQDVDDLVMLHVADRRGVLGPGVSAEPHVDGLSLRRPGRSTPRSGSLTTSISKASPYRSGPSATPTTTR